MPWEQKFITNECGNIYLSWIWCGHAQQISHLREVTAGILATLNHGMLLILRLFSYKCELNRDLMEGWRHSGKFHYQNSVDASIQDE